MRDAEGTTARVIGSILDIIDVHARRAELLAYFGESYGGQSCATCDNCLSPKQMFDGTLAAQKLLT